jgi:hypothetical protein
VALDLLKGHGIGSLLSRFAMSIFGNINIKVGRQQTQMQSGFLLS